MLSDQDAKELLRQFPPIQCAFAYGSGAIEQQGYKDNYNATNPSELPMIDLIFVVKDPMEWHRLNMILNPSHYSTPFPINYRIIAWLQDTGAGLWYNPLVPLNIHRWPDRLMKYGIISESKFVSDLLNWNSLYSAGRLHKPVLTLFNNSKEITIAINKNRESALRLALLLLPKIFNEIDLYIMVASLSYLGDPRMGIGENPRKVVNLVVPVVQTYRQIYADFINKFIELKNLKRISENHHVYTQDVTPIARWRLCENLPSTVRSLLMIQSRSKYLKTISPPKKTAIRAALSSIVAKSATMQSFKGLLSAGLIKCSIYIYAKILKRFSPVRAVSYSNKSLPSHKFSSTSTFLEAFSTK